MSLIIFNLTADSRLSEKFSVEELLDILTSISIVEQKGRVIDVFLETYKNKDHDF